MLSLDACAPLYGQCGGQDWRGVTQCCSGATCQYQNQYYSQCLPSTGSGSGSGSGTGTQTQSTTAAPAVGLQSGVTTRYWDCCKASCGWSGKATVSSPVKTCARDGFTQVDVNAQSGCNGGSGFMCSNQMPWNVSASLSYGYAAAYITVLKDYFFYAYDDGELNCLIFLGKA